MVGLSAAELQAETLFPGDTIEYFSMAFVAGDPRGHRVSKVLRVDRQDDEFPIRVDTQEMLPLTIMLKRKRDRNDVDISSDDAKWRKLRTFRLVDGEVEAETRADRLNAGLKKGLEDAMKATKKMLAKEKAEKANAGSKKIMSNYFTTSAQADETRGRKYSIENQATPERKKKKRRRKSLTPRDNADHHSSSRSHEKVELKKKHGGEKASPKRRHDERPEQKFKYDKPEPTKHTSLKRKRSGLTPTQPKHRESTPRKNQKTISKFFGEEPRKKKGILGKFIDHVEEIHEKQSAAPDLNAFLALENEKNKAVKTVEDEMKAAGGREMDRPNSASSNDWNERRTQFRSKQASVGIRSWLKPLGRQKGGLEDTSSGTPKAIEERRPKQRTLNLTPAKPATVTASPKMNRKSGLSFMNSGDASHRNTDVKSSKHLDRQGAKRDNQPVKKRGSLGTVSARAPKNLMGQWNHKKIVR